MQTLLVICFDAIGDFILSLPALGALQLRYPDASIELLCSPRNVVLAQQVAGIAACHAVVLNRELFDKPSWALLRGLRSRHFDLVINLFDEPDAVAMAKMLYIAHGKLLSLPLRYKNEAQQKLQPLFRAKAREVAAAVNPHFVYRMFAIVEGAVSGPYSVPAPCNMAFDTSRFGRYVVVNLAGSQQGNSVTARLQQDILAALPTITGLSYLCFSHTPVAIERPDLRCCYPDSILDAATLVRDAVGVCSTDTAIVHIAASYAVPTLILMNSEPWREAFIPLHGPHHVLKVAGDSLDALKPDDVTAALCRMLVS
ncbi:heptosyltransferase [Aeromonas cavernicola]|uniref:Heptosyltransferase n=1 Tax=Aeromonas cavernicola TaxID=1006623 RepID=A0A2H9U8H9_9GAMM|nr:heptosyltransferase [Aeromonas cavernicola]